jgi:hypothetical protein
MQGHHPLRQKTPSRVQDETTPLRSFLAESHPETEARISLTSYGQKSGESPLRMSSLTRSRGLLTTDNRRNNEEGNAGAETDLYYSTGQSSLDLMTQANAIHRFNKGLKR